MLIDEVVSVAKKFGVDGVHLDNGQAWPQIMEPDLEELQRIDINGEAVYTPLDLMNGEVVIRNENHGFWNTNNMESYPNPFFIKMCRKLWELNENLMIIGECLGGYMFEHRQIILARSGVIPRLYKLPSAISQLFGRKLHTDGRLEKQEKGNVGVINNWYEDTRKYLPNGSILLQSSTSHSMPYPAYLYGRGAWAAIDILFFMPDVPITFMGELDGDVYKVGQASTVFQHQQVQSSSEPAGQLKRSNSQIILALASGESESTNTTTPQKKGLIKVSSGVNIAANYIEQQEGKIDIKEKQFQQVIGGATAIGFDLKNINEHYQNRRALRKQKMVLRYGDFIGCSAKDHKNHVLPDILCYARYSLMETCIIATSITDQTRRVYLDLTPLLNIYKQSNSSNTVVIVKNLIGDNQEPEYYFLKEFVQIKKMRNIPAFRSLVISLIVQENDIILVQKCIQSSLERTRLNLISGDSVESENVSLLFSDCIENHPNDIHRFANVIGTIQNTFLDKLNINFRQMFTTNYKLSSNAEMSTRLMHMTKQILDNAGDSTIGPVKAAQSINISNKIGPIVFLTSELGRWSTVGGLGVMVDELSIGISDLGEDVIVISPYYDRNRKGKTGYLAEDPAPGGINYVDTITVDIGGKVAIGIHEGIVSGVRVVFLHEANIFPSPYPDAQPSFTVQQLAVFSKACLEWLCVRKILPSVIVTNDWFCGFAPGYARIGAFGDTFKGTTFIHICHNLNEAYQGRIYLSPQDGTLQSLHQLPVDWLIDPSWDNNIINPSRCAVMISDQWSTVSKSYRDEILAENTLQDLLRQKPQPFAHPNGIPIPERVRKLDLVSPDHLTAKALLQKKYFNLTEINDDIPVFAFVGRVTTQKGVHLILDIAETIIKKFDGKIQFLVGGPANMKDPYAAACAHKMWNLRSLYPQSFWAAPEEFFMDGSLVNRGADFGLMPSAFEPGGIVQHEFFVGETPVVAFKTGGLKDSVIEFQWDTEQGSGFTFETYTAGDMVFAMERAMSTYFKKDKYLKLRENAFKATMSGDTVSKAWLSEFYRLRGKIYCDPDAEENQAKTPWTPESFQPINILQELFGIDRITKDAAIFKDFKEIDNGAADQSDNQIEGETDLDNIMSDFDKSAFTLVPCSFQMHNYGPQHKLVQICGSFDGPDWKVRHDMNFDDFTNQWYITLHLKPGSEYTYKYIINENYWVINEDEPKKADGANNVNNVCKV